MSRMPLKDVRIVFLREGVNRIVMPEVLGVVCLLVL